MEGARGHEEMIGLGGHGAYRAALLVENPCGDDESGAARARPDVEDLVHRLDGDVAGPFGGEEVAAVERLLGAAVDAVAQFARGHRRGGPAGQFVADDVPVDGEVEEVR